MNKIIVKNYFLFFSISLNVLFSISMYPMKRSHSSAFDKQVNLQKIQEAFEDIFTKDVLLSGSNWIAPIIPSNMPQISNYLKNGANPNVPTTVKYSSKIFWHATPLMIACGKGYSGLVNLLLEHGAQAEYRGNNQHFTPLTHACHGMTHETKNEVENRKIIVKNLIKHGADVNIQPENNYEKGPLFYCAERFQNNCLTYILLKNGAKITHHQVNAATQTFIKLRDDIKNPLPWSFSTIKAQDFSSLHRSLPADILKIILFLWIEIHNNNRTQNWKKVCDFVFGKESQKALLLLPFMSIKEQEKICKSYYLAQKRTLDLKKIEDTPGISVKNLLYL